MFKPIGLFKSNQCPDPRCIRSPCPLSHQPIQTPSSATVAQSSRTPINSVPSRSRRQTSFVATGSTAPSQEEEHKSSQFGPSSSNPSSSGADRPQIAAPRPSRPIASSSRVEPIKRPIETPSLPSSPPPAKLPKVAPGPVRGTTAPSATSLSTTGAPILNINAVDTNVPLKDRQRMVTVIYETYRTLYSSLPVNAHTALLPGQHAIAQEAEIYARSQKTTYRNNGAHTITAIKKRAKPNHVSHPSVGTQGTIEARRAEAERMKKLTLKRAQIEHAKLSREQLKKWGYVVEVPDGPGGTRINDEGQEATCERCQTLFVVRAPRDESDKRELSLKCTHHWGRMYVSKVAGRRESLHRCCGASKDSPGCAVGPHVFKDSDEFDLLHSRHPYTYSSAFQHPGDASTPLEIAALDCEMIYTTAGMSLARVSVVDGSGKSVYDKLVKLDAGVEVLDYNTRFSGVKSLATAELDLEGVRRELRYLIGPETILIGHALENDMRALRMVHYNVVDTAILFPHPSGPPYRRALRDLAREHLGLLIQNNTGGAEVQGHSSLEDAIATLDLVKFWVREQSRKSGRSVS